MVWLQCSVTPDWVLLEIIGVDIIIRPRTGRSCNQATYGSPFRDIAWPITKLRGLGG